MADKPILFSAPMVRALLEGRKTQTRRVLKPQPNNTSVSFECSDGRFTDCYWNDSYICWEDFPYFAIKEGRFHVGDRLWVREAWNQFAFSQDGDDAWPVKEIVSPQECQEIDDEGYRFSAPQIVHKASKRADEFFKGERWRPSIHMPRWASRLTLIVESVKVERLQDISEADAIAEGMHQANCPGDEAHGAWTGGTDFLYGWCAEGAFKRTWELINGPSAWKANPWVVAVTFRVVKGNIDQIGKDP